MTPQPPPRVGDLLAGRYRLVEHTGTDDGCARFRARDERLQREVLVDVATEPAPAAPAAAGVRELSGADDTGMHEVLDGGAIGGRPFVVRELAGAPFDTTEELHTGDATAVMPVPVPLAVPDLDAPPTPLPRPRRDGPRPLVLGLIAAAVVAVVLTGLAFGGSGGKVLPTTTTTEVQAVRDTGTTPTTRRAKPAPTTTAPTTTVPPTTTTPTTVLDPLPPVIPPGHEKEDGGPKG